MVLNREKNNFVNIALICKYFFDREAFDEKMIILVVGGCCDCTFEVRKH